MNKIELSKEDKELFYITSLTLNPLEFIQLTKELDLFKDRFTKSSWKWICSVLGRRAQQYLKNVIKYQNFMGEINSIKYNYKSNDYI